VTEQSNRATIRWGAVAIGAMAGVVVALVAFILLGISGIVSPARGEVLLLFVQFLSLVVAGYVAGRLSAAETIAGSLAALLSALVSGLISITSSGVPIAGIITLTLVAAVLGAAGGVLARWQRESVSSP